MFSEIKTISKFFEFPDFIESECGKHEQRVELEVRTKSFNYAKNLIDSLKQKGVDKSCKHDIPLILHSITNTEEHPPPEKVGGIDLKYEQHYLLNLD